MMKQSGPRECGRPLSGPRARWWRDRRIDRIVTRPWRGKILRGGVIAAAVVGLFVPLVLWLREAPRVEPPFERLVGDGAGPVVPFALADIHGTIHTNAEWAGHPAIVLYFLAANCPVTHAQAPAMARLAREFTPRGVLFLGIHPDPNVTDERVARHAVEHGLPFVVMRDPGQVVTRQAGATVTPAAVVLAPDGQVFYRGRIGDAGVHGGRPVRGVEPPALKAALESILADEMPLVCETPVVGTPIAAGPAGSPGDAQVTYAKDVAPILYRSCVRCHRPGEVGPFSLVSYRDAARRAGLIAELTAQGRMPPSKPHAGAGVFLDVARLSVVEKDILARWAETGCAEGNASDLPPTPQFADGWQLGAPDVVLTMPETFVVPADGPDIYRSFALPFPLDQDVIIKGIEFRPDNRRVVHHGRIHLDDTGDARRLDALDPQPGFGIKFKSATGLDLPYPGLGAWTPGMTARFAPSGAGRRIPRGSSVVLQIHYHPSGKREPDRSSIGLYLAREPVTRLMAGYTICTPRIDIAPGEKRHKIILSTRIKADVHLYTVVPHAHYLCREFRLAATLPDGTVQPLLWIDDWDMDWQDQYRYARPVRLPKGTVVTLAAYFDNTADNPKNPFQPPRRIRYGVETTDEMCACHLEFLPDDPSGYVAYPGKSPFGL